MHIDYLFPPKLPEGMLEAIEQTRLDIAKAFHVRSEHLGKQREKPITNNRSALPTNTNSHKKTPKIG